MCPADINKIIHSEVFYPDSLPVRGYFTYISEKYNIMQFQVLPYGVENETF